MQADDAGSELIEALSRLEAVADTVTPDEALRTLDEASLQVFWRDWPQLSSWAGALWRRLNQDLEAPSRPLAGGAKSGSDGAEPDGTGETGGSG